MTRGFAGRAGRLPSFFHACRPFDSVGFCLFPLDVEPISLIANRLEFRFFRHVRIAIRRRSRR